MTSLTKYLRWCLVVWVLLYMSLTVSAQTYRSPELRQTDLSTARQKLMHAEVFNLGGVGFGQTITPEEKAFRTILGSIDPVKMFQRLVSTANPEGQLYALLGLHLTAPEVFRTEVERIDANGGLPEHAESLMAIANGEVRVAHGCIFFNAQFRSMVDAITNGKWDAAVRASSGSMIF